eukprot:12909258-Prorocentrum_lima.AAC.1
MDETESPESETWSQLLATYCEKTFTICCFSSPPPPAAPARLRTGWLGVLLRIKVELLLVTAPRWLMRAK